MSIVLEDQLKKEIAFARCLAMLKEVGVPHSVIKQVQPGPFLDQICHMIAYHKMPWYDAFRWAKDHAWEILEHARTFSDGGLNVKQDTAATAQTNGRVDGNNVVSPDQTRSSKVGDVHVSVGKEKHASRKSKRAKNLAARRAK